MIEELEIEHRLVASKIAKLPQTPACDEEAKRLNDRLWEIRALISTTRSQSPFDLIAKAQILLDEAARDPDFECHVLGSARDLARSLAADVKAMHTA